MTLIEDAKKGKTPHEVEIVARKEGVDPEKLTRLLARGRVVIPRNVRRKIDPIGIGETLTTKVNLNLGSSKNLADPEAEVEKAVVAMEAGADTVMDLSTGGDLATGPRSRKNPGGDRPHIPGRGRGEAHKPGALRRS
jgi:phosphomethylpyrimidine synthase